MLPTSLIAILAFSFAVGFGAVISPGPISTAIVSQAPRRGWQVGPLVATGHSLMELIIVALVTLGLGAGMAHPGVRTVIALLGGALLLYMGGTMIFLVLRGKIHLPGVDEASRPMSQAQFVGLGMLATLGNPFWYAWWVTAGASYLAQARLLGLAAVAAFYLGHIAADFAWDTALSTIVGGGRRWMTDRVFRALILACGAFFLYLGGAFLVEGLRALL